MFNVVADHVFTAIVLIVFILAFKEGVRDFLTVMGNHGAVIRQAGVAAAFRIAVQIGHHIEAGIIGDTPCHAGHHRVTLFLERIELGIGITRHAAQACRDAIVIIKRPGDIKHRPTLIVITGEHPDFATRIE